MHLRFYISSSKSNQVAAETNRQLLWVDTCDQTKMVEENIKRFNILIESCWLSDHILSLFIYM